MTIRAKILSFWNNHIPQNSHLCVAVSGGADSVALFYILFNMREELGINELGIAHVNHGLRRKESDGDAAFVRGIAAALSVPFFEKRLAKKSIPKNGIEEWARNQRYSFLASVKKKYKYDFIATAHTANDQAETVLLRLLRGSGICGLSSIAPVRDDGIIRPILNVDKSELKAWLFAQGLSYREDSSNSDTSYTRNWLRHDIMPLIVAHEPQAVAHVCAIANDAAKLTKTIFTFSDVWLKQNVVTETTTNFVVSKKGLLNDYIASEALASLFRKHAIQFDRGHIQTVLDNCGKKDKTFLLPGGWEYKNTGDCMEFFISQKKTKQTEFSHELKRTGKTKSTYSGSSFAIETYPASSVMPLSFSDQNVAFLDADKVSKHLVYRSYTLKDKFVPYGRKTKTTVHDFLKKQGIAKDQRDLTGVVSAGSSKIVWVVGMRTDDRFKVTATTRRVLKISYKPKK